MRRSARNKKKTKSREGARVRGVANAGGETGGSVARTARALQEGQASAAERPRIGLEASISIAVPHEWTIQHYDPRLPPVLSTPAMIGLMEMAAAQAVQTELAEGSITVGTRIEVDHLKAVSTGASVRAHARLVGHEGRFLVFEVEARSEQHLIGRGRVFRVIVEPRRFAADAHGKRAENAGQERGAS